MRCVVDHRRMIQDWRIHCLRMKEDGFSTKPLPCDVQICEDEKHPILAGNP